MGMGGVGGTVGYEDLKKSRTMEIKSKSGRLGRGYVRSGSYGYDFTE